LDYAAFGQAHDARCLLTQRYGGFLQIAVHPQSDNQTTQKTLSSIYFVMGHQWDIIDISF
jgi:hypothetical protein